MGVGVGVMGVWYMETVLCWGGDWWTGMHLCCVVKWFSPLPASYIPYLKPI